MVLLSLVWPTTSVLRTEAPVRAATRDLAPLSASSLWLAPTSMSVSRKSAIAAAVEDLADGKAARALPVLERAARDDELGGYALLYLGRAQLALARISEARATAARLLAAPASGYLGEASLWFSADVAEAAEDWPAAVEALRTLTSGKPLEPERANLRLGRAAIKAGDNALAITVLNKVFYEFPLSSEAAEAAGELAKLAPASIPPSRDEFLRLLGRAQELFGAKRYADARPAFSALQSWATGDDRALVDVRVAACDYHLKHYAAARDALLPLIAPSSSQQIEAEFLYLSTLRELGQREEYVARARAFVVAYPADPMAEETLNNLATHYVLANDDEQAAAMLDELYSRFPTGPHANRAAWRSGWWKYKAAEYVDAARIFESAAATFAHDDYRPSWLYWAARAHQRLGERDVAIATFRRVVADYRNSYYGRQAARALASGFDQVALVSRMMPMLTPGDPPPNAEVIRDLLAAGLYDTAILEVRKAQLEFGTSPMLDATIAYALNRKGDLRGAITRMRRAYPQFLAEGGETLPQEIRQIIFPIAYWNVISRYARRAKPRSLSHGGARGAGVNLPTRGQVVRRRLGLDANRAEHRPALRRQPEHPALQHREAEAARGQRPHRHGRFLGLAGEVWQRGARVGRLQRGRQPRHAMAVRTPRLRPGRVHRRHSLPRDAELCEARPRDGGRLPRAVREPEPRGAGRGRGGRPCAETCRAEDRGQAGGESAGQEEERAGQTHAI